MTYYAMFGENIKPRSYKSIPTPFIVFRWIRVGLRLPVNLLTPYLQEEVKLLAMADSYEVKKPARTSTDNQSFAKEPLRKIEVPFWREFRVLMASKLYASGKMSSNRAAKMAGVGHVEFLLNLNFYQIFPLEEELHELERGNG